MFNSILVPYDGSAGAERALRQAVALARLCDAQLSVLTVFRHHSMLEASLSMVRKDEPGPLDDAMRGHAREVADYAKRLAREAGAEGTRAFIKAGPPARTIIRFAREHGNDLIVIGSRGLGSVENYLLGSVSHKVTGLADCPVLVV
ncbi:universal stress protein UspA [Rhodovulum sulfidophilum]|uniref:Universal stress protein n=1 Tax=Rhodovulum visakhapatnamense TaxID=364297 RepID=A0ABS1RCC6_9RHOB|nr:universal stress protein [Rhodovulum visakhapatnamense]MBL3568092.1 universal stress protein [Rhodovulum visakhapatnamense]MBL3577160.1 universal stress protein [Rhodovulum visakhapatnamense]OLS45689.1 universal stress protein UspA [Rhodovulum sulfidophilum]